MRGRPSRSELPSRRQAVLIAVAAVALAVVPAALDIPYVTALFVSALLFGMLAATYDLMLGYAGLNVFGFAGYLAVGAYSAALATRLFGIDPWWGLAVAIAATAAAGIVTGVTTLRLRGIYFGLMTWFFAEGIRLTISNTPKYTRGAQGLSVDDLTPILGITFSRGGGGLSYYYLLLLVSAVLLIGMLWLVRSRWGRAFMAIREDETASKSLGLNVAKYKLLNLTIAAALIGVLGWFYAHYVGVLSPSPEEFGVPRTVEILTIAYVGGRGTLWGPILAAFLLTGFEEVLRDYGPLRLVLLGCLLIAVMLFARGGLAGLIRRWL